MHHFRPIEPGVDQCTELHPESRIECGKPAAHDTHVKVTRAPEDETSRRRRAINDTNKVEAAFAALVKDETSPMTRVFCAIAMAGTNGATDNELYVHPDLAGMPQSTIRPRRIDLQTAGLVTQATDAVNDHVRRPTGTGGTAQVWVLTDLAVVLLRRANVSSAA